MDKEQKISIIQFLMTKTFIKKSEFADLVLKYDLNLLDIVKDINKNLSKIGLELRSVYSDYQEEEYFGICQLYEDPNSKDGIGIKPEVIQYFYKILEISISKIREKEIILTYGEALDLVPESISMASAQEILALLQNLGYIEIEKEKIFLGPRALLEFRPKLSIKNKENEDEIYLPHCLICLDFLLAGFKCQNCNNYIHKRCLKLISNKNSKCPHCESDLQFEEFGYN